MVIGLALIFVNRGIFFELDGILREGFLSAFEYMKSSILLYISFSSYALSSISHFIQYIALKLIRVTARALLGFARKCNPPKNSINPKFYKR